MADNPIKYSDFVRPDNSITDAIKQLESLGKTYEKTLTKVKTDASAAEEAIKKTNGATKEGQEVIKRAVTDAEKLTAARKKLGKSMTENAQQLADLKERQREQNNINKLTAKLNKSQAGSYDNLSAQYSLMKIRINKMSEEQRRATKTGRAMVSGANKIYAEMKRLQEATGKTSLNVGNYTMSMREAIVQAKIFAKAQGKAGDATTILAHVISTQRKRVQGLTGTNKKYENSLRGVNGAAANLGASIKTLAGSYLGLMGARRLMSSLSSTMFDFEKVMSGVKAISGATGDEFTQLEEDAQRLGASTSKTAKEVGLLQTEYAKLGFSTQEILDATEASILLSEATGEDVALAAETAGATIRGFGKDASETGIVVDVMAKSFTSSALNLNRFSEAMGYVAPIAKAANISLEQTTAAMSALADAGIHGSRAGTALRMIISQLDKSGKPFGERLQALAEKNLTLADAEDEVGRRAQTALLVLADNTDKIAELKDAYDNAAGSAKEMADIQRDNVAGATKLLSSAWDGFILKFTKGGTVTRSVVDSLTAFLGVLTRNAVMLKNISKFLVLATAAWVAYKLAVVATNLAYKLHIVGMLRLIRVQGLTTVATNLSTGAMIALNTAIKANPVGLLISLATAAASALWLFSDSADAATESQDNLNESIKENKFDDLIGKKVLARILETPDAIDNVGEAIKKMSSAELSEFASRVQSEMGDLNREIRNMSAAGFIDEDTRPVYDRARTFYEGITALIKKEQEKTKSIAELTEKEKKKLAKDEANRIKLRLSLMEDGEIKELAVLANSYEQKKKEFTKLGLDKVALEYWVANERYKINKKYRDRETKEEEDFNKKIESETEKEILADLAKQDKINAAKLKAIGEQKAYAISEIDLLKVTEAEKTKLKLQAEKDRLKAVLDLNKKGGLILSKLQIDTIKNQIKAIGAAITAPETKEYDLYSMAGLNLTDEQKDAIGKSTEFAMGQLASFLDAKIQAANRGVELADKEVDNAWRVLDAEMQARSEGYASNVSQAQKDLALAKKTQASALKEQEKANKAKLLMDSINQASSLVTSSALIWGQLGFPWAIPALAVMWGSFAFSKVKAAQVSKPAKTFGDGGMGIIEGGSHASGDDVLFGSEKDGTERRAEGGEAWAVLNKRSTAKYKRLLPSVIASLNKGDFEKKYGNAYSQASPTNVNVVQQGPSLIGLERDVKEIKRQGERKIYTDAQGHTVETYKNLKTVYVN